MTLGIYPGESELDHDAETLVAELLSEMRSRGVPRQAALSAIRRAPRGLK